MDKLPTLDIETDLQNLQDTDEETEIIVEDLSCASNYSADITKPSDIFMGKPTNENYKKRNTITSNKERKVVLKKDIEIPDDFKEVSEDEISAQEVVAPKKKLSEKQKAHLERIRIKARDAKLEKARLKKEIKEKVEIEVKAKRSIQKGKKISQPEPEKISEDFKQRLNIPSDEEKAKLKQEKEQMSFLNFMSNMEKYKTMKYDYKAKKTASAPKTELPPKLPPKQVQSQPLPTTVQPKKPFNEYDGLFEW